MWPNSQKIADLVKFTEEILNGKVHFLCSEYAEDYFDAKSKIRPWNHCFVFSAYMSFGYQTRYIILDCVFILHLKQDSIYVLEKYLLTNKQY